MSSTIKAAKALLGTIQKVLDLRKSQTLAKAEDPADKPLHPQVLENLARAWYQGEHGVNGAPSIPWAKVHYTTRNKIKATVTNYLKTRKVDSLGDLHVDRHHQLEQRRLGRGGAAEGVMGVFNYDDFVHNGLPDDHPSNRQIIPGLARDHLQLTDEGARIGPQPGRARWPKGSITLYLGTDKLYGHMLVNQDAYNPKQYQINGNFAPVPQPHATQMKAAAEHYLSLKHGEPIKIADSWKKS